MSMRWAVPLAVVVGAGVVLYVAWPRRPASTSALPASTSSPSTSSSSAPTPPVVADKSWRALTTAVDAGRPLRVLLHRDAELAWGFAQPSTAVDPTFRFDFHDDGSVTLPAGAIDAKPAVLRSGIDGLVSMLRATDGGRGESAVLVDNTPWPAGEKGFDEGYDVHISKHAARAQVRRDGATLTGYYRYPSSREDLELTGKVQPDGRFTMVERTRKCVVSGRWTGVFLGRTLAAGEWESEGSKNHTVLSFWLLGSADLARYSPDDLALETVDKEANGGAGCTNSLHTLRASGLAPPARNAAVNKAIDELTKDWATVVSCDGTEPNLPYSSELTVTEMGRAPGYLSISVYGMSNLGGAHPMHGGSCALIDTRTGQGVSLLEVLGDVRGPAKAELMKQMVTKLRAFWKDNGMDADGDPPTDVQDEKLCYGGPDSLEIRFSPYEVAPYMFGPVTLDVDLAPLLPLVPSSPAESALFGAPAGKPDASIPSCPPSTSHSTDPLSLLPTPTTVDNGLVDYDLPRRYTSGGDGRARNK